MGNKVGSTVISHTENTRKALAQLESFGRKPVIIDAMRKSPRPTGAMGQHWDEDDCHRIFIEEGDALAEHSVVHEILHGNPSREHYPDADLPDWSAVLPDWRNFARDIRNRFVDCLDHQVVYRRMVNDFSLDMPTYFAAKAAGQISAINQTIVDMPSYYPTHSYVMPEILAGLDYPLGVMKECVS